MAAAGGSEEIGEGHFLSDEVNTTVVFPISFQKQLMLGDRRLTP